MNPSTDTLGEDRLLDEVQPIRVGLETLAAQDTYGGLQGETCRKAASLLARLCARVRHLEARLERYEVKQ